MKCNVLEMGKSAMRPSWMYKLGYNSISIEKEEKHLSGNTGQLITRETHIEFLVTLKKVNDERVNEREIDE